MTAATALLELEIVCLEARLRQAFPGTEQYVRLVRELARLRSVLWRRGLNGG